MRRSRFSALSIYLWVSWGLTAAQAQGQTVGLFVNDEHAFQGYTLFSAQFHQSTYLIDMEGRLVHRWQLEYRPRSGTYLLENGDLLRAARSPNPHPNPVIPRDRGGSVRTWAWDGTLAWVYSFSDSLHASHHDVARLPNGNVLMIVWEHKNFEEALAAGRDPATLPDSALLPLQIVEVEPTPPSGGTVVWQWHVWDHLIQDFDATKANFGVVEDHPERIDVNFRVPGGRGDWQHTNAIAYNPALDQIIVSTPFFNELWIIDHSTTSEEAAGSTGGRYGRGGDLLYRWGNPRAYRAGTETEQTLFFQHDTHWIDPGLPGEGNILLFNNRAGPDASVVLELTLPEQADGSYGTEADGSFSPAEVVWTYSNPDVFYSSIISGAQRLPNGNTLIAEGERGRLFEVTREGDIVWEYVNPVTDQGPLVQGDSIPHFPMTDPRRRANAVFRAYRYGPDYPGLQG